MALLLPYSDMAMLSDINMVVLSIIIFPHFPKSRRIVDFVGVAEAMEDYATEKSCDTIDAASQSS